MKYCILRSVLLNISKNYIKILRLAGYLVFRITRRRISGFLLLARLSPPLQATEDECRFLASKDWT